ncbi:MAG: hypothetical protein ACYTJ0_04320 [Planctomycetota bacterium]|jgi:hypothetical protein
MGRSCFFGSLTRISDLAAVPFASHRLPRERWSAGDYVIGRVISSAGPLSKVELTTGRMAELTEGDLMIGALGVRSATLETVGDWQRIGSNGRMEALTSAGLFGRSTSRSPLLPPLVNLAYQGHAVRDDRKVRMADFAPSLKPEPYECPTVLLVGSSMSAGKTASARVIVRQLARAGLRVVGAKLTGAGRYRDVLAMADAGAERIFDFVDVGLPSTVCEPGEFAPALDLLLTLIARERPDVVVAEAGASPLEPYNGETVMRRLQGHTRFVVLCASDPYAVVGVMRAFRRTPDLVAGIATSTSAGSQLVRRLSGGKVLNLLDRRSHQELNRLLRDGLGLGSA